MKMYYIEQANNYYGEYEFDTARQERGTIVVDNDGWFEGFIGDSNFPRNGRLIFGILHDKKAIKMYSVSATGGHEPTISEGINEEEGEISFEGPHFIKTMNGNEEYGVSRIIPIEQQGKIPVEIGKRIIQVRRKLRENNLYMSKYQVRKKLSKDILMGYSRYIENRRKYLVRGY